jgi:hypothetical protein
MRKLAGILGLLALHTAVYAEVVPPQLLDKVIFQISAKQWVTTQTALLKVEINATLSNADLIQARKDIMDKLNVITKGDWHLTQFERTQESSGLEKLIVEAEVRVAQDKLTNIYGDAKKVSKPGANYQVRTVEFKPSLDDIQQVKTKLREQLYQQVNAEMTRINAVYTAQHYSLSRILFIDGEASPVPQAYAMRKMNIEMAAAPMPSLAISNELTMTAMAEVASNRLKGN